NPLRLITDLLQHYQLTEWLPPVLAWLSATTACREAKALTLQLAWHSCNALLLNARSQLLSALIPQAQQQKLPVKTLTSWLTQLASESQCYYPLELSL
ncbi:MAG TPA: hypothetical protein VFY01_02080, partial [Rheinheimera sp.]|nr:hypothetical protein [Rheinheimera sp.]